MKKYKTLIISLLILLTFCVSICFVPIDATRFIPQVEEQFKEVLGIQIHIEKLIFRFGPSLKIKAPVMHLMYEDGQKFGQLDNVKFFVPWSTLFNENVHVKRIYADKFIVRTASNDKYLKNLLENLNSQEYDEYPNIQLKNYNISYNDSNKNKQYTLKGTNLELTKLENYKNIKLVTIGDFCINKKQYINYNLSILPNIEMNEFDNKLDLADILKQIESLDFHTDIIADLKIYNNFEKEILVSGLVNLDNISVLDPMKKNPKSFIYLTFLGNKIGILSNIYASADKKIYAQGVINNSKKPDIDLKVKTDKIKLADIYTKIKLLVDCSKYKGIDSIDGIMSADFNIKGDLNKLKSSGYLKISDANIKAGRLNIKNISSDVDFSNNTILISNAIGYVNNAPITLKGKINKNLDIELLTKRIELKHLLPEKLGIEKGVMSLNARIFGTQDNIQHNENVQVEGFRSNINKTILSFDNLNVDTNKNKTAYISNIIIKPMKTEQIKLPMLRINIENDKLKIPDTNIFMPNSKLHLKAEIENYNSKNLEFNLNVEGFINSKDLSGFTKVSNVYPVKFNIAGTKETQYIDGQIQLLKAVLLDEPSVVNINAKYDKNNFKIEDFNLSTLGDDQNKNFNKKLNKKVLVNGTIENIQNPVFKNIRVYIPQQVNLNVNDVSGAIKGDIFISGKYTQPEIVGQLTVQNLLLHYCQLMVNSTTIDFNKNIAVINAPIVKIGDTSFSGNATLSTDFINGINVKNANIKSKYLNADTLLMYKDNILSALPINVTEGKLYAEKALFTLYNSPLYLSAVNSKFSLVNNIVNLTNITAEAYNGKLAGNSEFNVKDESFCVNMQGRGISASPIFDLIAINKDTVSGTMDFDTSLKGNLSSKQSLNGNIRFIVHNGHMGTLGKLEHLLYAQNVIADSMLRTSLSVITKAITLKDTGLFKYLRGDIVMKNGIANINMLQSQGPLMSLFIKGQYNPITDYAKLIVLGRLSDEIVSSLGAFGEFSFNKLMVMLTGEENNKFNFKVEDIEKLPQLPMKNTKEFRTVINGILEKPSSVIQFNWISYTQKSLRQNDVPMNNEKVPDFIEALPY